MFNVFLFLLSLPEATPGEVSCTATKRSGLGLKPEVSQRQKKSVWIYVMCEGNEDCICGQVLSKKKKNTCSFDVLTKDLFSNAMNDLTTSQELKLSASKIPKFHYKRSPCLCTYKMFL